MTLIPGRTGKIGVYGPKTRLLQRKITNESFGLTWKTASVYLYLGDRSNLNPDITDIGSFAFWEIPDKAFAIEPVEIPIAMEPKMEGQTDFSRFGIINPLGDDETFRIAVDDYQALGRNLVVGDVFEIPFFERNGKSAFWEINDVDDSQEVEKFIHIIHASNLNDQRTTREIPIDNSNDDLMNDLLRDQDDYMSEQVPVQDPTFEDNPLAEEVDYRRSSQKSFLDDPDKEF